MITWYAKLKEKLCNCRANYIKIITFITQYYKLIQLHIFNIMAVTFGKCRCKSKLSLIKDNVTKTLILKK
jgi:hypothetical protein